MTPGDNLYLVGLSGAGKSTLACRLGARLNRPCADLDDVVVEWEGVGISELFREKGELYFRRRETEALAWAAGKRGWIVATGGGVVTREENIVIMKETGRVVFLDRPVACILRDLTDQDVSGLPMLQGDKQRLYALREARLELYRKAADYCLVNKGSVQEALEAIVRWVNL